MSITRVSLYYHILNECNRSVIVVAVIKAVPPQRVSWIIQVLAIYLRYIYIYIHAALAAWCFHDGRRVTKQEPSGSGSGMGVVVRGRCIGKLSGHPSSASVAMATRPRYIPAATPARLLHLYISYYSSSCTHAHTHTHIICEYRRAHVMVYIITFFHTADADCHVRSDKPKSFSCLPRTV